MSCECVTAAAGVVTEGAFEGLFTGVELDVAQQVALLREGRTALVTLEWPLTYQPFFSKGTEINPIYKTFVIMKATLVN